MIYADTSFLVSLYVNDVNSAAAVQLFSEDRRRPLYFTPWQRFEFKNSIRLAERRILRAKEIVPWQTGNLFKRLDEDLRSGRLKHEMPAWLDVLSLAEDLSALHAVATGAGAVDFWHVAAARILQADTFWTFDEEQFNLARATGSFRHCPDLL